MFLNDPKAIIDLTKNTFLLNKYYISQISCLDSSRIITKESVHIPSRSDSLFSTTKIIFFKSRLKTWSP